MVMAARTSEMALRARMAIRCLDMALDREPALFIEQDGKHWLNEQATLFVAEKGLSCEDLVESIKSGGGRLREILLQDIRMELIGLPAGGLLVLLKNAPNGGPKSSLTPKEKKVLIMLIRGLSNKQIAGALKMSPGTVNSHLDNIYRKFGCSGRLQACLTALNRGFICPPREKRDRKPPTDVRLLPAEV